MLKSIYELEKESRCLIIQDSLEANGEQLFLSCIVSHAKHSDLQVNLLCFDHPPEYYKTKLKQSNINYCDIFLDPLQWIEKLSGSINSVLENFFSSENCNEASVIFIDSASPFFWFNDATKFFRSLQRILTKVKRVVICVHKNTMLDSAVIDQLKYFATTFIEIKERIPDMKQKYLVNVTHVKPDGKFERRQEEMVTIDSLYQISTSLHTSSSELLEHKTVNMSTLTTFDLGVDLSASEKEARSQLILPYLRTSDDSSGKIVYEVDNADLEEDPDDDLEL